MTRTFEKVLSIRLVCLFLALFTFFSFEASPQTQEEQITVEIELRKSVVELGGSLSVVTRIENNSEKTVHLVICEEPRFSYHPEKNEISLGLALLPVTYHFPVSPRFKWLLPGQTLTLKNKVPVSSWRTVKPGIWELDLDVGYIPSSETYINVIEGEIPIKRDGRAQYMPYYIVESQEIAYSNAVVFEIVP